MQLGQLEDSRVGWGVVESLSFSVFTKLLTAKLKAL